MFGPDDFEVQIQQENPPGIHAEPSIPPAQDEEYGDFIVKHGQNMGGKFLPVNELFGILYIPLNEIGPLEINSYTYASLPKCYTFMDADALNSSGITRLHNHPYLKLQGEGTVIAVIDSGIDYLNPIFRNGDVSRIAYIWDQTIPGNEDEQVPYGKVFTGEEINQALLSENPQEIVPSLDENGHGTAMAGLAAGNFVPTENFSGAAPKATIIVVKLKKAKSYLRKFYQYPPQAPVFQEDDIMLGISFAVKMAQEMGMPVSVCLGLGTNQSAHVGDSELSRYVDYINEDSQVSVSVAAGNEGAAQHHYTAELDYVKNQDTVELRIADKEEGFSMEFWGDPPDDYGISLQSPAGEKLYVSSSLGAGTQELSFIFVETKVLVNYVKMERMTGKQLIYFRFFHPVAGIWKVNVSKKGISGSRFHMWLPVQGLISPDTYFLESTPYITVTAPGDWLKGFLELGIESLSALISDGLIAVGVNEVLRSLLVDGIIAGVGGILTFLPNIFILFLALAFLEDSGYMARVAYVMEGIMSKLGLSGRAFIPMILGFGCTVPAIMASRSLENRRDRFKVMLITPFMSCSARLPIYILFAEMFFQERAMLVAYSMYLIGLVVAILVAAIIHLIDRRKSENYLLIELPEYKAPSARTVAIYVWEKVKDYLTKAGTTIFVASILMWVILNFGPHGYTMEMADSFGSILGHWLVPIFAPIGLGFWQIAVALIAGISAKEVVVSSCAVLFGIPNINSGAGMDTLVGILSAAGFGQLNAFCLMIFCLLYVPCAAALATIRKESGSTRWMLFSALFQLVVAWAVTFVVYRVGLLL